jgi:hypothetical protein
MKEGMKNGYLDRLVSGVWEYEHRLMKEKLRVVTVMNCMTKSKNTTGSR